MVSVDPTGKDLADKSHSVAADDDIGERCRVLSESMFPALSAARQIVAVLETQ